MQIAVTANATKNEVSTNWAIVSESKALEYHFVVYSEIGKDTYLFLENDANAVLNIGKYKNKRTSSPYTVNNILEIRELDPIMVSSITNASFQESDLDQLCEE